MKTWLENCKKTKIVNDIKYYLYYNYGYIEKFNGYSHVVINFDVDQPLFIIIKELTKLNIL